MWLGKMLGYDGDGCLIAMEHKAEIERVTEKGWNLGIDMDLGVSPGVGINKFQDNA